MSDVRNSGDAWVTASDGKRYWGTFGAAGLLAHDRTLGILLQHRVDWSDHGGTWGIPGGALHEGETALAGALRESYEEAAVPESQVKPSFIFVLDRGEWQYTTVLAEVDEPFFPQISDPESHELRWVAIDEVSNYPLHPAFSASWESLKTYLGLKPVLIFDCSELSDGAHFELCPESDTTAFTAHLNTTGVHPEVFGYAHTVSAVSDVPELNMVFPNLTCAASQAAAEDSEEQYNTGYRLAHQARISGFAVALITPNVATQQKFQSEGGIAATPADFFSSVSLPSRSLPPA